MCWPRVCGRAKYQKSKESSYVNTRCFSSDPWASPAPGCVTRFWPALGGHIETPEIIALVAGIVAVVIAIVAYRRSGAAISLEGVQESYVSVQSMAAELEKVGLMAVASAQQLKESGKITTNSEAYNHAFDYINRWFPALDRQIVAAAVEGAYKLYKLTAAQPPSTEVESTNRFLRGGASELPPGVR